MTCSHCCSADFSSWNVHAGNKICSCLNLSVRNRKESCLRSTSFQKWLEVENDRNMDIMRVWEMKATSHTKSPGGHSTLCYFPQLRLGESDIVLCGYDSVLRTLPQAQHQGQPFKPQTLSRTIWLYCFKKKKQTHMCTKKAVHFTYSNFTFS